MKALKRRSASISNSRWLAYATAGVASAFAAANSAEGTIHYSGPINLEFRPYGTASFQLDQPGDSFRLDLHSGTAYAGYAHFGVVGIAGASIAGFYGAFGVSVSHLSRGQLISSRRFVGRQIGHLALGSNGQFAQGGVGYIGFRFNNGNGPQFGWVRIDMKRKFYDYFVLRDFAYGDVGDTIEAGQKMGHDMPELESLGGLALGAVGLLAWRKSRSQAER